MIGVARAASGKKIVPYRYISYRRWREAFKGTLEALTSANITSGHRHLVSARALSSPSGAINKNDNRPHSHVPSSRNRAGFKSAFYHVYIYACLPVYIKQRRVSINEFIPTYSREKSA